MNVASPVCQKPCAQRIARRTLSASAGTCTFARNASHGVAPRTPVAETDSRLGFPSFACAARKRLTALMPDASTCFTRPPKYSAFPRTSFNTAFGTRQ